MDELSKELARLRKQYPSAAPKNVSHETGGDDVQAEIKLAMEQVGAPEVEDDLSVELAALRQNVHQEEAAPEIPLTARFLEKTLAADPQQAQAYWQRKIAEANPGRDLRVEADPTTGFGTNFQIKNPYGKVVGETDPQTDRHGFSLGETLKDTLVDLPGDFARGGISNAIRGLGVLAAPETFGASLPVAMAASGALEGGMEAARQKIGQWAGVNTEMNPGMIGVNAALGAAVPGMGAAWKAIRGVPGTAIKGAAPGVAQAGVKAATEGIEEGAETAAKAAAKDLPKDFVEGMVGKAKDIVNNPVFANIGETAKKMAKDLTDDIPDRGVATNLTAHQKLVAKSLGSVFDKTTLGAITPRSLMVAMDEFTPEEQMFAAQTVKKVGAVYRPANEIVENEIHYLKFARLQEKLDAAKTALAANPEDEELQAVASQLATKFRTMMRSSGSPPAAPEALSPFAAVDDGFDDIVDTLNRDWGASVERGLKTKLGQEITDYVRDLAERGGGTGAEWAKVSKMLNAAEYNPVTGNPRTTVAKSLGRTFKDLRQYAEEKVKESIPEYSDLRERMWKSLLMENARRGGKLTEMLRDFSVMSLADDGVEALTSGNISAVGRIVGGLVRASVGNPKMVNYIVGGLRKLGALEPGADVLGIAAKTARGVMKTGAAAAPAAAKAAASATAENAATGAATAAVESALKKGNEEQITRYLLGDPKLTQTFLGLMQNYFRTRRKSAPEFETDTQEVESMFPEESEPFDGIHIPRPGVPQNAIEAFLPPSKDQQIAAATGLQSVQNEVILDPQEKAMYENGVWTNAGLDEMERMNALANVTSSGRVVLPERVLAGQDDPRIRRAHQRRGFGL